MVGGVIVGGEIERVGVVVGAVLVVEVVAVVGDVVEIVSEFEGVVPLDPGNGVDELMAALIRIGRAVEEGWLAEAESGAR